jgi:hypothetical protein
MVAVVTELMVGGERSTQDDSIKGSARTLVSKLRLRALLQSNGKDTFVLDNIFALIDGYIDADFPSPSTFPLHSGGGPYNFHGLLFYRCS